MYRIGTKVIIDATKPAVNRKLNGKIYPGHAVRVRHVDFKAFLP